MEVIAATERVDGSAGAVRDRAAARRRPRRRRSPIRRDQARRSAGSPTHDLDDIVASAWRWHSTHLDGYDESTLALTLPIEPAQQNGDRPRIVAQTMAGARDQRKLGRAVSLRQLPGVDRRHAVVVVAVHHQQRSRGANRRAASTGRNRRSSRPTRRTTAGSWACGSRRSRGRARGTVEAARPNRRSRRVGSSSAAPRTRGSSAATQVAIEPPVLVPTSQIPVGVVLGDQIVDRGTQIVDPALQREVALARRRSRGS